MNLHVFNCFLVLIFLLMTFIHADDLNNWSKDLNSILYKCSQSSTNIKGKKPLFFDILRLCFQKRTLDILDDLLTADIIPVYNGLNLVRYKEDNNITNNQHDNNRMSNMRSSGKSWRETIFERVTQIFKTHILKIDIDRLTGVTDSISQASKRNRDDAIVEGRRRHHRKRNSMMPMLMMGMMVMGSVLIPMGFQFLAVLGGKALILAKLALMLSSIQGLKRVATSGFNYGLYQTPGAEGWHDRSQNEAGNYYGMHNQAYPNL